MTKRQVYDFFNQQDLISKIDLRHLLEFYFNQTFAEVLTSNQEVSLEIQEKINSDIIKIKNGYPFSYVIKEQDFYKSKFYVDEGVLIPRSETEYLVEQIVKELDFKSHKRIMDIGAGSGCIGISLLLELGHDSVCLFIEKSPEAIKVLKENLKRHQISDESYQIFSDLNQAPEDTKLDLIVSNPPYIDLNDEKVDLNVRNFEPHMALFAPENGYDYLKRWSEWSMKHLKNNGKVFFEFGLGQQEELCHYSENKDWEYQILKDQYDVERFWILKNKG